MEKQQENKDEEETNEVDHEFMETEEVSEGEQEDIVKDLSDQIEVLQDKLLRQLAESENIRTRSSKMIDESREYAIFDFTKDLMPVMDNLQRALEYLPENMDDETKNMVEGLKMTKSQLESAFKKHHLESIEPHPGEKFDYNNHYAISQVVTEDFPAGSIVSIMQVGYKIKDRLIRPASVTVSKAIKK